MPLTLAAKNGPALTAEIHSAVIPFGKIGVWWLGQATFCFKFGATILFTDPFYSNDARHPGMLCESPLKPEQFSGASIICCTHDHLDHIDPETLPGACAASPNARLVLPRWHMDFVAKMGVSRARMDGLRGDDSIEIAGIKIHAIPCAHESLEYTEQHGHRYLGYIFEGHGARIYLAGDIQPYPGWYERIVKFPRFDAAFLPISARDNLHYLQAVYFCALHRPALAVPMHYNMFPAYTEDPQKFVAALKLNCPDQRVKVMTLGEGWTV